MSDSPQGCNATHSGCLDETLTLVPSPHSRLGCGWGAVRAAGAFGHRPDRVRLLRHSAATQSLHLESRLSETTGGLPSNPIPEQAPVVFGHGPSCSRQLQAIPLLPPISETRSGGSWRAPSSC